MKMSRSNKELTVFDESRVEEKTLALLSALAELVVDSKEEKQISGDGEWIKKKEVEENNVSEGITTIDDTEKKWLLTKERRCKDQVM